MKIGTIRKLTFGAIELYISAKIRMFFRFKEQWDGFREAADYHDFLNRELALVESAEVTDCSKEDFLLTD